MAKEKKEKTPGYEEFHDALQSGAVGNVYIFHGEETYLMQQAVAELQAGLCRRALRSSTITGLQARA